MAVYNISYEYSLTITDYSAQSTSSACPPGQFGARSSLEQLCSSGAVSYIDCYTFDESWLYYGYVNNLRDCYLQAARSRYNYFAVSSSSFSSGPCVVSNNQSA
jgi:hypothetical protein